MKKVVNKISKKEINANVKNSKKVVNKAYLEQTRSVSALNKFFKDEKNRDIVNAMVDAFNKKYDCNKTYKSLKFSSLYKFAYEWELNKVEFTFNEERLADGYEVLAKREYFNSNFYMILLARQNKFKKADSPEFKAETAKKYEAQLVRATRNKAKELFAQAIEEDMNVLTEA